jgi:hypothetical protein
LGLVAGLAWSLAGSGTPARAQWSYPGGYGSWGWGGWGGGSIVSNPNASFMTGLGNFAQARGKQEVDFAKARAINEQTVERWNKALRERQRQLDQERAEADAQQAAADAARRHRLNIENGAALNRVLDQILEFNAGGTRAYAAQAELSAEVLRDIPFEAQTEAITVCLDQMTGEDGWPSDLQADALGPARAEAQKAVDAALAEDLDGGISEKTAKAVADSVKQLRAAYAQRADTMSIAFAEADSFLRTLGGLARMLGNPRVQPVVRAIESYKEGDVGDLIGFMHAFNLRFGPAKSDRQKAIYHQLYPMLVDVLNDTSGTRDPQVHAAKVRATDASGKPLQRAAREAFQGMTWEHYEQHDQGRR